MNDERVTLYFSGLGFVAKLVPAACFLAFAGWRRTFALELAAAVMVLVVVPVWMFSAAPRRIEIDHAGLTVVPVTPLRRKRRYPFSALGSFDSRERQVGRANITGAEAPILDPALKSRLLWGHARDFLAFGTFYTVSPGEPPLSSAQLAEALNSARASLERL